MITFEYKTITITSLCKDCSEPATRTLQAYVAPCGLAYHQSHHGTHSGPEWTVTHVASGLAMGPHAIHFETAGQCISFIGRVGELANWLDAMPALTNEIKATVDSAAQECQSMSITYL